MKILVCQLRNHGDIIRTFPLLESLKEAYDCSIDFTCLEGMEDTCRLCGSIDEIITQPRLTPVENHGNMSRVCDVSSLENLASALREKKYDAYIDLHGVFQSSLTGVLGQIPVRIGRSSHTAKDGAYLLYTHICNVESWSINKMERHFRVAGSYFDRLECPVADNDSWMSKNMVAILPGSSEVGRLKRWGLDRYLDLGGKLSRNFHVVYLLGPEERELKTRLLDESPSAHVRLVEDWTEYLEVFNDCKFVAGNDSAALHLSIWKQIPTYMICGPTSGIVNGIWKDGMGSAIHAEDSCMDCNVWSGNCLHDRECMTRLTVGDVYGRIMESLDRLEVNS